MRKVIGLALVVAALAVQPAVGASACDRDPECNAGRGSLTGYVCVRSEINNLGNEFNGRLCYEHPRGRTWYAYVRHISNRQPLVLCREGAQIYPEYHAGDPDFCTPVDRT